MCARVPACMYVCDMCAGECRCARPCMQVWRPEVSEISSPVALHLPGLQSLQLKVELTTLLGCLLALGICLSPTLSLGLTDARLFHG